MASGMSLYTLSHRLQTISGKTVSKYIREVRLQKALERLRNEECTVAEVAFKRGFGSPAYFNKCFHDFYGFPPGKIKKGYINYRELKIAPKKAAGIFLRKSGEKAFFFSAHTIVLIVMILAGRNTDKPYYLTFKCVGTKSEANRNNYRPDSGVKV